MIRNQGLYFMMEWFYVKNGLNSNEIIIYIKFMFCFCKG